MIRGFFDKSYQSPIPKVVAGLILPWRDARYAPIEFVVDTGASATCLHPNDAIERMQFTDEELAGLRRIARADRALSGITGAALYFVVPARYLFARDDWTLQTIDGEIRVAQPIPGNENIPSVLGWDILEHFRIVLDRRTGEVQLQ
ncbi:MAG: hypothetical protein ACRDJE_22655 [Dehalococcoidia bacterium]